MIERHEITGRDMWLEMRKQDVTASAIGALFGAHPYMTALRLYMEKSGVEFPPIEENKVMRRGRLLEGAVALAVADALPEWRIAKNNFYYRDTELRLGATPDFLIDGDPRGLGVLQTKTAAPSVFIRDWNNGKEIPFWITLQNLVECMLTGATFGVVAVMSVDAFNLECVIIPVPRHDGAEQRIKLAVMKFWDDVAKRNEPAPDYGRDASLLPLIAPLAVKDKLIDLSGKNEMPVMLEQRERIIEQIAGLEKRKEEIETELKFEIRDGERVVGLDDWSISYKNQDRAGYTVPPKTGIRVLRIRRIGDNHD